MRWGWGRQKDRLWETAHIASGAHYETPENRVYDVGYDRHQSRGDRGVGAARDVGGERTAGEDRVPRAARGDGGRGFHRELGYESLFLYCRERLGLSKASAFRRTTVAKLIVEFPTVLDYLRDGRVCLTTVCELRDVLAPGNHRDVLDRASGMTEEQAKELAAELGGSRPELRDDLVSTGDGDYQLVMRVSRAFVNELAEVSDALGHKIPSGDFEDVMRECFRVTLAQHTKHKVGVRPGRLTESDRGIPTAVRIHVWERDGACCAFVGADGRRCGSRRRLEFEHIVPEAKGGRATIDNVELLCRIHNQHRAVAEFGATYMAKFKRRA